eukprot:TRINITY_DN1988_c0_g1_i1.p1 TRINITY_DN1988_c0_g1~~TRINITY_DN1988_c0_g1_i1.p1  ORF type:complete len:967 (+),score=401.54 TRINITY_DN1988_c0_g1_i1:154-3054(+)
MRKKPPSENVQVVVRARPLSKNELEAGTKEIVHTNVADNSITVSDNGTQPITFTFDQIFNRQFSQKSIYLQTIHPLVESVLAGYNATVFAYGQSGTGKTYTMTGDINSPEKQGVIPHALQHIFQYIQNEEAAEAKKTYTVSVSYVELYNGRCRDLLVDGVKENLQIKENEQNLFYVKGLEKARVLSVDQCLRLMGEGLNRREVGSTLLNQDSSRSHSVFAVEITCENHEQEGPSTRLTSKLNLVDLAGSERQSKTAAEGDRLKEGSNINLSLTALGTVIDVLVKGKGHIPFRSSPLTMLLKDSLGGSCRTVMFATCSPADMNCQETLSTLRFADRAKRIKNKPRVQMDPKDELIQKLRDENAALRAKLNGDEDPEESHEALQTNYEALQVEVSGLKSEITTLQNEAKQHERRYAQLQEDGSGNKEQMSHLEEHNAALTAQLKELSKVVVAFFGASLEEEDFAEWKAHLGESAGELLAPAAASMGFNRMKSGRLTKSGSTKNTSPAASKPVDPSGPSPPANGRGDRRRKNHPQAVHADAGSPNGHYIPVSDSSPTASPTPPASSPDDSGPPNPVSPVKPPAKANRPGNKRLLNGDAATSSQANGADVSPLTEVLGDGDGLVEKKEKKEKKNKSSAKKNRRGSSAASKNTSEMEPEAGDFDGLPEEKADRKRNKSAGGRAKRELQEALARLAESDDRSEEVCRERDAALEQLSVQQAALDKMRQQAALKMKIVEELKEDIAALSSRLQDSSHETRLAVEHAQERLIAENNRRHEKLIKAHEKELQEARKAATEARKKIKKIKEATGEMESKYDEKVVAFDNLLRDFEELKLQNMKMFQNGGEAAAGGRNGGWGGQQNNPNNVKLTSLDPAILKPIQQVLEQQRMTAKSAPLHHVLETFDLKDTRTRPMSSVSNNMNTTTAGATAMPPVLSPHFAKAPLPNLSPEEEPAVMPVPQPPQSTRSNGARKYD